MGWTMKTRRMAAGLMVAGALVLGACGGGGGSTEAYCEVYDQTHAEFESLGDPLASGSYDELTAAIDQLQAIYQERRDAAPTDAVRDAYDVLMADEEDDGTLSQDRDEDRAVETINSHAEKECDLPGDM
jgi:hypothetical protein